MIDWGSLPNFSQSEFTCHCGCGRAEMNGPFMDILQAIRTKYGRPMKVNSGFRCQAHDQAVGGAGVHPTGCAGDFGVAGEDAFHLTKIAFALGITGYGSKQKGPWSKRFLHIDTLPGGGRPRTWTY